MSWVRSKFFFELDKLGEFKSKHAYACFASKYSIQCFIVYDDEFSNPEVVDLESLVYKEAKTMLCQQHAQPQ